MINLGDEVKDKITGFRGIVIAICKYLNGCISVLVQPKKLTKDGTVPEPYWVDEQRLTNDSKATAGGPGDIEKFNRPPNIKKFNALRNKNYGSEKICCIELYILQS